jgi:hypothetical protein
MRDRGGHDAAISEVTMRGMRTLSNSRTKKGIDHQLISSDLIDPFAEDWSHGLQPRTGAWFASTQCLGSESRGTTSRSRRGH